MEGYIYSDGGRAASGFKGVANDCVTRAIAIATQKPYKEVYNAINTIAKNERKGKNKKNISNARNGVYKQTYQKYMLSIGWKWVATMKIGEGCKTHLDPKELPNGILILSIAKHLTTMIDGIIYDTFDPRHYNCCVYGYFYKPNNN